MEGFQTRDWRLGNGIEGSAGFTMEDWTKRKDWSLKYWVEASYARKFDGYGCIDSSGD